MYMCACVCVCMCVCVRVLEVNDWEVSTAQGEVHSSVHECSLDDPGASSEQPHFAQTENTYIQRNLQLKDMFGTNHFCPL